MKKIIIFLLVVALSFYPSVTSFAADETTEIQESLPIPNPGPPTPEPQIDPPTPPEPTPKNPSSDPASWDNADEGGDMDDGLELGPQMPYLGDSRTESDEDINIYGAYIELYWLNELRQETIENQHRRISLQDEVIKSLKKEIVFLEVLITILSVGMIYFATVSIKRRIDNHSDGEDHSQDEKYYVQTEASYDPEMHN